MKCAKPEGIVDTCICIDLCNGALLDALCLLPYELILSDVLVRHEVRLTDAGRLLGAGVRMEIASGQEVGMVVRLRQIYPQPSTYDLFALAMAISRHAVLLSNDKHLRKAALREGVNAIGILGLLDTLETTVPRPRLAEALESILNGGSHLPATECESRIRRWRQPP